MLILSALYYTQRFVLVQCCCAQNQDADKRSEEDKLKSEDSVFCSELAAVMLYKVHAITNHNSFGTWMVLFAGRLAAGLQMLRHVPGISQTGMIWELMLFAVAAKGLLR